MAHADLPLTAWRLKDADPGEGLGVGAALGEGEGWLAVSAPGDTYLALIAAGRLQHPYEGRGEEAAAWVREREWWWTTTFSAEPAAAGERLELVFEGLDTFATVYLDGEAIGRADNMFRRWTYDVTEALRNGGEHVLSIAFAPTFDSVPPPGEVTWGAFTDRISRSRRNMMRKAQFGWGWDWGPDLPTVGVWMPARLERRSAAVLASVYAATLEASAAAARLRVGVEVAHGKPGLRVEAVLSDPDGKAVATAAGAVGELELTVPNPRLWWTAGLGGQPLYRLTARLFDGDAPLDEKCRRVGIRTLALDMSEDPDEAGCRFFRFVINGVPIFAKGANWIPIDSFVAEADPVRYRALMARAAGANMNMIRVWGGGIYEPDVFYDACDEEGLLVWQDFMFACAQYPEKDAAFAENVRAELEDQVRRLRGHACLALWCGNNENQIIHDLSIQLTGSEAPPLQGLLYYDEMMPRVLAALDPLTPYRPSSPFGGGSPNSMREGDVHNWTVWHGIPVIEDAVLSGPIDRSPEGVAFTRYAECRARFVSEFGIQAAPDMATLKRWMAPEDLVLNSPGFVGRVKDEPEKANAMMIPETGVPADLEQYVDFSQWTQAEGMAFAIEHYRRRMPHCSGTLIWQLNDCWPSISWSLIDYDGVAKAAHYATARAFAPVMASFKPAGDGRWELWVVNDRLEPVTGEAVVALTRLSGGDDWSRRVAFAVAANSAARVWAGEAPSRSADRVLTVRSGAFPANRKLLAPVKDLALAADARPRAIVTRTAPGRLEVQVGAPDRYLPFVRLRAEAADVRFGDNHFDLAAGESRTVAVTADRPLDAAEVLVDSWRWGRG